ncbi:MAG: hypothetical protein JXX29_04780 [Deltaproteobacteria bacterium]|nr:hypothetical protein [Deltaproteobacteria bacterium]MBN2670961.1 hypothetical protein [Deltaproteobacteria bacterium]
MIKSGVQIAVLIVSMMWVFGCSEDDKKSSDDGDTGSDTTPDTSINDTSVATESEGTDSSDDTDSDSINGDTSALLTVVSVLPGAISVGTEQLLTIQGTGFEEGMTVSISLGDQIVALGAASIETGEAATVLFGSEVTAVQGLYDVTVTLADGTFATLDGVLSISILPPPIVTNVEPALAWVGTTDDDVLSDKTIQISGEHFVNTPWVTLVSVENPDVSYLASEVNFIDENTLIASIPSESAQISVGAYYVWVSNPDELAGQWLVSDTEEPGIFEVTDVSPPQISAIDPVQHPFNEDCTPFTVLGQYFSVDATVSLLTADGEIALEVTTATDTELVTSIPADTVELGLYPVKVVNPDGQSDTFYAFEAKSPTDGHFTGNFDAPDSTLATARERHGTAFGFDMRSGTHMYVVGGLNADNEVLGNAEVAAVNIYGEVGEWRTLLQWQDSDTPRVENALNTPRSGHVLLRLKDRLYAFGGNATDTSIVLDADNVALDSIETATILGSDTMVDVSAPTRVSDGDLPYGTWYYRISAVGAFGEGLASNEVQILNTSGTVEICFDGLPEATSYNVYRSIAGDGRPGTTRWIASVESGSDDLICYQDAGETAPSPGFVSASVFDGGTLAAGIWVYRIASVVNGVESIAGYRTSVTTDATQGTVVLTWDPVPGATYNVYRTNVVAEAIVGTEDTFLIAEGVADTGWTDDGSLAVDELSFPLDGVAALPIGSLSRWQTLDATLTTPREGAAGTVVVTDAGSYMIIAGGRGDGGTDNYLGSVEFISVLADGALGDATAITEEMQTPRAFLGLSSSQPQGTSPLNPDPLPAAADTQILLFAVAGDESFTSPAPNSGLMTIEAAILDVNMSALGEWTVQDTDLSNGRTTYAGGSVVVDQYLYAFPGVDSEQEGVDGDGVDMEPSPLGSLSTRFEIVTEEPITDASTEFLTNYMSSNGGFVVPRSYYGTVRVNSHIYIVGGNDGLGPVGSMERISQ